MTPAERGQATRERHLQAQMELWNAQREAINAARSALTKLMGREDASPAEILRAAEMLVELGKQ